MEIAALFLSLAFALLCAAPIQAAGDPCAVGASASPQQPGRGRIVLARDIASYVARHAEIACAKLDAFLHDVVPGDATAVAKARAIQGELEIGVLRPLFSLYFELRDRDLTAADAPGAAVKLGPSGKPPSPRQMGFATAQHLYWVSGDADRRFSDSVMPIASKRFGTEAPKDEAGRRQAAAVLSEFEDIGSEIGFVGSPAVRNYPGLWKVRERELQARIKDTRTPKSDANFRETSPPPGSVRLSAAAAAQMRAFQIGLQKEDHGCHVLGVSWSTMTRWRGPDDAAWHETGPSIGIGAWGCGQIPPDVVRTIDGIRLVVSDDKDHHFAGKTIDYVGKTFIMR